MNDYMTLILDWMQKHGFQIVISLAVVVVYKLLDRLSTPKIEAGIDQSDIKDGEGDKAVRIARIVTGFVGFLILLMVWGIDYRSVFIFASTTFTLLSVAFFAGWSLLSNITAHFVLLLNPAFKRGTFIRVIEADNYAEGYVSELGLFSTTLISEAKEIIVYPNNLLTSRTLVISPRIKLHGIGKLPPQSAPAISDTVG